MAKIVDQDIPPELQAIWAALHSPAKKTQGSTGSIRGAKKNKRPRKKPRRNLDAIQSKNLAILIQKEAFTDQGKTPPPNFVFVMTQALILGIFDIAYFRKCPRLWVKTYESVPSYGLDPAPPPYSFRINDFLPSVPAYPNGTQVSGGGEYAGAKSGTLFADNRLRWRRQIFKSKNALINNGELRVMMRWECRIDISASLRGSRPMVSLNLGAFLTTETASVLSSKEPPVMTRTPFYWRFQVPPAMGGFYQSFQIRKEVKPLSRILKKSGTGQYKYYLLDASNRPMMGRGFNNNNSVETSFDGDPELWEIKECIGRDPTIWEQKSAALNLRWQDVVWAKELSMFIAVATDNGSQSVMTSPDGKVWTIRNTPSSESMLAICWSKEKNRAVAVAREGTSRQVIHSTNGITWGYSEASQIANWTGICYSPLLGIFCAVAGNGIGSRLMTSPNGLTWSNGVNPGGHYFRGVCWSESRTEFVAMGNNSTDYYAYTSSDGINWSAHLLPFVGAWGRVIWSEELEIYLAATVSLSNPFVALSKDGINWEKVATPQDTGLYSIIWSAEHGMFLGTSYWNAPSIWSYSFDGYKWEHFSPGYDGQSLALCFSPELCRFVAPLSYPDGNVVMISG